MAHEKFKHGSEDELRKMEVSSFWTYGINPDIPDLFLKNFVAANPAKSIYGFTLNRRKPGHFNLCFLANKNSTIQTWVSIVTCLYFIAYSCYSLSALCPNPIVCSRPQ